MEGSIAGGKDDGKRVGVRSRSEEVKDDWANVAWMLGMNDLIRDEIVAGEEGKDMVVEEGGGGAVAGDGIAYDKDGHCDQESETFPGLRRLGRGGGG